MKKMLFFLLFVGHAVLAQFAVFNPSQDAYNILDKIQTKKQTVEAIRQTAMLRQQVSTLKKTADFVKKVNQRVKTVYYLTEMEKVLTNTIKTSDQSFNRLKGSNQFTTVELNIIVSNFGRVIMASNRAVGLGNMVIEANGLKMDDFQRIERLSQTHKDLLALNREIKIMNVQYEYMAQSRSLFNAFKK